MKQKYTVAEVSNLTIKELNAIRNEYTRHKNYREKFKLKDCKTSTKKKASRVVRMLNSARIRAENSCREFSLDAPWLSERIERGFCEVTGIKFSEDSKAFCPSIDRKDNSIGYTKENCQVVVWIYNRAKNEDTHEEVLALARALLQ